MYDTLESIAEVAIGVAGFSGVIVVLQRSLEPLARFRLKSLLSLAAEVIVFSFLPALLGLVVDSQRVWNISGVIYGAFHMGQVLFSYVAFRHLGDAVVDFLPFLDKTLMAIGVCISSGLLVVSLFGIDEFNQFVYTSLLLWALGIAGLQFFRILLLHGDTST